MNANFSLPTLVTNYPDFLAQIKSRDEDIATWFDGTTSENLPNKTKRWNSLGSKFEKWNGTAWSDLSILYEIKVRDSDKLNGQSASYYAVSNHVHTTASTTANGFMSSTDKSKLNGIAENANDYSHPTGDGNLHVPANGTANNGKFLQATAVAGVYSWANVPATSLSTLGITATAAELNILDGCLITVAQLNYLSALSGNVQTQLNAKAPLASPALTGTPTAPTAAVGTNTTQIATTAFVLANVDTEIAKQAIGSVGSHAFLSKMTSGGSIAAGETLSGASLRYAGVNIAGTSAYYVVCGGQSASGLSGTWKAMGYCEAYAANWYPSTLWLRIA